jgi:tetratricopeptide (TPR) repeat protein
MAEKAQDLETQQSLASVEATIQNNIQGGTESSCNNNNGGTSAITSDADHEKSLEFAEELMEKGSKAEKENDYAEATEFYSRALEIRVSHHGELSPLCVIAYYKYGRALLYKAQDEADPLGTVPKKEVKSEQEPNNDGSVNSAKTGQTSGASKSINADEGESSNPQEGSGDDENGGKDMEEDEGEDASDAEDLAEGDEDDSDLDLAWKMLDVARLIVEKNSDDTVEKVDILSTLAEVALEREDIETSLSDYLKALSMLERVVEPDSRLIAELNFRICLCLEIGSKAQEAIPYCEKAISVCKTRVERLQGEIKAKSDVSESDLTCQNSANQTVNSVEDKKSEIETLTGLSSDLEKKLEDLQQLVSNPTSILSDILGLVSAKAKANMTSGSSSSSLRIGTANSTDCFESATISTTQTNGESAVKHLGVVGRGVKRLQNPTEVSECNAEKKQAVDSSENQDS